MAVGEELAMWLALFGITGMAAIAFTAAAIIVENRRRDLPLCRLMRMLDLDAAKLARAEPHVFWKLEARCRACDSGERCARDLASGANIAVGRPWRDYCPNRAMLDMLVKLKSFNFYARMAGPR